MAERLVRDVVPVDVTLPGGTRFLRARVFITTETVEVWTEAQPPELAYAATLDGDEALAVASTPTPQQVVTRDGLVLMRRSLGACTCSLPNLMGLRWPTTA